jgi:hypothetical protein
VLTLIASALPSVQVYQTAIKEQADLETLRFPSVVLSVPGWRRVQPEEAGQVGNKTIVYTVVITIVARDFRSTTDGATLGCEEMEDAILAKFSERVCVLRSTNAAANIYLRPLRRDTVIPPPSAERGGRCVFVLTCETTEAFL